MHVTIFRTAGKLASCDIASAPDNRVDVQLRVGAGTLILQMDERQLAAFVQQANRHFERQLRVVQNQTALAGAAR